MKCDSKLSAACCVLIMLMLCITEQLRNDLKGLARGGHPPSPVRMRALVEGYSGAAGY